MHTHNVVASDRHKPFDRTNLKVNREFGVITAVSAVVAGGGTGYTLNDQITLVGGTFVTAAVFNVDSLTAGVIDTVSLVTPGSYSIAPGNPVSVTGGTGGDDATLTVTFLDELDELKFEGWALPGTADSDSGWQLAEFTVDFQSPPNILTKKYAQDIGGESNGFIFVWNDRATFTYGA